MSNKAYLFAISFLTVEMTMISVTSSGVERSLFQKVSEISPLHFVSVEMTVLCHSERSRGISCQTTSEISPLHSVPGEMTVFCHSERSRGISCQTASEISPLHFVTVEMTMISVIPSEAEESLVKRRQRFLRSTPFRSK